MWGWEPLEERRLLDAAPVAQADLFSAAAGAPLAVASPGVLANDSDADGDLMSVVLTRQPENGRVALAAQGGFQYLASPTFTGRDSFEYRVLAAGVLSAPATVSLDVSLGTGRPLEWPVWAGGNGHFYRRIDDSLTWDQARQAAESQTFLGVSGYLATINSAQEDAWLQANLASGNGWLGGYQDPTAPDYQEPAGGWRWVSGEPWSYVNWALNEPNDADGERALVLWPASHGWADQHGEVGSYYVEFNPAATARFAADDIYVTGVGAAKNTDGSLGVLGNDTAPAGAAVTVSLVEGPAHGALTLQANGAFSYQPVAGYQGSDAFRYKLVVNGVESEAATAWLKVGQNDHATVARKDYYTVAEDEPLVIEKGASQPDYSEDFSGSGLPTWLEGTGFTVANGSIRRTGAPSPIDRQYIRTVRGDYLTQDFVAEVSYTTSNTPADSLMYFGLGEGQPGGGANEPINSVYFRLHTPSTAGGYIGFTNAPVSDSVILGKVGHAGLHRARFEKVGEKLTVEIDADYDGTFSADFSYVVANLSEFAPFLNGQNAHLFFGTALNNDRFDDFTITMLPRQGVLANDSDDDGQLSAELVSGPARGTLDFHADGTFAYQPAPNASGVEEFTYRASDGISSATTTVRIDVTAVNDPTQVRPDLYNWNGAGPLAIDASHGVLANDSDVDSALLKAILASPPEHGSVSLADDGSFVFTPGADFMQVDSFTYRVDDGDAQSNPVLVFISALPVGASPLAAHDVYEAVHAERLVIPAAQGLLANDYNAHGDALSVALTGLPEHGHLTLSPDGSFSYLPDPSFLGRDSFSYRALGGGQESNLAIVSIEVGPGTGFDGQLKEWPTAQGGNNHAYVLLPGSFTWQAARDQAASLRYRGSPGHLVTITSQAESNWLASQFGSTNGWLGGYQDGSAPDFREPAGGWKWITGEPWTYTNWLAGEPNNQGGHEDYLHNFPGWNDRPGNVALVGLFVEFEDYPSPSPEAADDLYAAVAGSAISRSADQGVLANDYFPSGTTAALVANPQHGNVLFGADGSFVYLPSPGYQGRDSFTYQVVVPGGETSQATVWLKLGVNDFAPQARDDAYLLDEDTTFTLGPAAAGATILANDFDGDGGSLSVELIENVGQGALSLNADGTFTYTPAANFFGVDTFTYRVSDGAWSSVATVSLTVRNRPDPTTAVDDEYSLNEDRTLVVATAQGVLANDQDLDGMPVGAKVVSNVTHGSLDLHADGSFVYTPGQDYNGVDQFTYKVVDAAGVSNTAVVLLSVQPINDVPKAQNDDYFTSQAGVVQPSAARGVLANDSDAEGDALTATLLRGPAHGTLVFQPDGSFLYTPAAGYLGQDSFTYRAFDGSLSSNVATVTLTVRQMTVDVALRAVANPSAADTAAALPSSLAAVDVGSEYYVEIWVQDVGAAPVGLPGGQLDLDFDTARSDALALGHGGLYNLIPTGAIDEAGGRIDDFGGGTINPAAANAPQWARLGYVRVLATADGLASYQLGPGALQFSRVGGGSVPWEQVDLSETLLVDHQAEAELEVRAVAQPTAVDAAGEVDALPASLPWVDEWSGYWVEVWVRSADQGAGQGISQAAANLLYDTRYGTAREIQYGPGFTSGRTGTIDDAAGRVTDLGAATARSDVGDDRFALLARVRFAPGASDQAPLDEAGHVIGPYDLSLGLSDPAVRLVGAAANGPTDLRAATLPIYAAFYDIDDNDQIDYGDLSYFAAAFGKKVAGAVEPPYVWWANFDRQGATVDFGDFSYLAANFGRTKEQGGLTYPANYPAAWAPLEASALGAQALDAPAQPLGGAEGMSVQLVARATPGAGDSAAALPAGLTQVAVGGTYTIEVWVQDSAGIGVTGGLVDINYPQGRVDAGSLEHGGVYTTFAKGALRELLGRADDLGGGSVAAALGAKPQWVRLGYFSFEVTGAGPLEFQLAPGQLQFSRFGEGNIAWEDVNLGSLTLNPALMGDVNSDHAVDLTDFGVLKANFGQGTTWAQGDLDGNGRVDLGDFGRFKENFGRTAAALTAVLPPPAADSNSSDAEFAYAAAIDRAFAFAADEEFEDLSAWLNPYGRN